MYADDIEKATEKGMKKGLEKGIEKGKEAGRAEGKAEGIEETKRDNARKMKALGATPEFISQVTGLSADEIEALL
jgi:predicted transposase/invertase (TIGR01784 family)